MKRKKSKKKRRKSKHHKDLAVDIKKDEKTDKTDRE